LKTPNNQEPPKQKSLTQSLLGCLGSVIVIFVVIGVIGKLNGFESENTDVSNTSPAIQRGAKPKPIQALQVSAHKLRKDYEGNEVAADRVYKGKHVLVDGRVDNIGKGLLGGMYVTLKSSSNQYQIVGFIQCFFNSSSESQLAQLQKGQNVTLLGKVDGKMGNILVKNCSVVKK